MTTDYTQDGLSLANICPACIEQEQLCVDCVELADAQLTDKAYQLVDDRYDEYRYAPMYTPLLKLSDNPSASDWVSSETVTSQSQYILTLETIKVTSGTYINARGESMEWNENWYHIEEKVVKTTREGGWLIRKEYLEPTVSLQDGGVYEELWELDDMRQRSREVECTWCHLLTPKVFNDCQSCDLPLESNVR